MKKPKRILPAGLLLAAWCGFIWLMLRSRETEPVYQGKTLSSWLDQYGTNHWMHRDGDLDRQAQVAIRHIGTNAIPIYLQLITTRQSPFKLKLISLVPKQWQAHWHLPDASAYRNSLHRRRSLGAFGIAALGPDAKTLVPVLISLLNEKDPEIRWDAIFALRSLGPVAQDALPSLINCLQDSDGTVQFEAILSLGEIHQEPERVIPILIGCLDVKHPSECVAALLSLPKFGAAAKPAVPSILKLLGTADASVRSTATNALRTIDPEAAAKAGVE